MQTMHLFAGGGGGLLADLILGHNPIIAVEWEPYACQILRERAADGWFPDLHVWEGDVRLFDPSEYAGRVDCIHAGFPCQDISVAGKQAGLGEGTRSGLYREVLRIAGIVRPKCLFLENVSAIVNLGLGTVLADLSALGYDCRWLTLRASDVGAPHHRDRWWCLATLADIRSGDAREGMESASRCGERTTKWREANSAAIDAGGKDDVADTDLQHGERRSESQQSASDSREARIESGWGGAEIPNTSSTGLEGQRNITSGIGEKQHNAGDDSRREVESDLGQLADGMASPLDANQALQSWWEVEPQVGRVTTGCQHRAAQLKALGNGQVPMQAAVAFSILMKK